MELKDRCCRTEE